MRLIALIEAPDHVCYRYRLRPFEEALAAAGIAVEVQPLARGPFARLRQLAKLRQADGVLLQRKLLPPWEILFLRRQARTFIYDVDDAVFLRDSFHPKGPQSWYRRWRFRLTVREADLVLAGNSFLAAHVKRAQHRAGSCRKRPAPGMPTSSTGRCLVIPTCVDTGKYPVARHENHSGPFRLVWIGSSSTIKSLEWAEACLRAVAQVLPQAVLRVVCDRLPCLGALPLELWPWSERTEAEALATADIGVAWMPADSWSRGKCGLKVLQYMAAGLPVIANPVGIHRQLVIPGQTGELAASPADWAKAAARLAFSAPLRRLLGAQGRQFVDDNYHPACWAPVVVAAVARTIRARSRPDLAPGPQAVLPPGPATEVAAPFDEDELAASSMPA